MSGKIFLVHCGRIDDVAAAFTTSEDAQAYATLLRALYDPVIAELPLDLTNRSIRPVWACRMSRMGDSVCWNYLELADLEATENSPAPYSPEVAYGISYISQDHAIELAKKNFLES